MSSSKALQARSDEPLSSFSSSIRPLTHDVFLSFRGDDVRQNFISHLCSALHKRGINTYIDNSLKKGEKISLELIKAIDGSMISIVVLSKNYSDSEWCLDELLKILECKEMVKQIVLPLFYDVDPSDVRHQKGSFGEAFTRVEYKFKDDKVKIAQWKAALGKVANLSGFKLGERNESDFILDIITRVDSIMGTSNVEGIIVDLPDGHDHDTISLSPNSFKEMKRLRIFICHNAHFYGEFNCLPNTLRVLNWSNYHLHDLPTNFRGEKLAVFKMHAGCVKEIISRKFKNLTIMKLSECKFLTKISDLSSCSNLKELDILDCENLVQVHDSVGSLDKLVRLRIYHCSNLKSFPRRLKLISLEVLSLHNCSKLENFPEIDCIMEFLCWISLWGTAIKELPSSTGYLMPALKQLFVGACTKLPSSFHRLQNLKVHYVSECINGCFTGMERLFIEGCKDPMRLPICVSHLQHPKSISLNCDITDLAKEEIFFHFAQYLTGRTKPLHITISRQTKTRSELESSAELPGQHLSSFYWYFEDFSFYCTSTLQELDLSGASIVRIPLGIESFVELRILKLRDCYNLQEILHLPPKLQDLYASECLWLERFPKISTKFQSYRCSALRELRWIDLSSCHKLDANIGSQAPNLVFVEE